MNWLKRNFYRILIFVRGSRPGDIPKRLDAENLEKALQEARFLFNGYGVDVRDLEPGEKPDTPKPANGIIIPTDS